MKSLIINADDFGLCKSVNRGIIECYQHGLVSDFSFMINLEEFDKADEMIKKINIKHVGFHLNLTVGKSVLGEKSKLADDNGKYFDLKILTIKILAGKILIEDIYNEIRTQIKLLIKHGYQITHIDSHCNIHLLPSIMKTLIQLNSEFKLNVPIRMPYEKIHNLSNLIRSNLVRIYSLNFLTKICQFRTSYNVLLIKTIGGNLYNNPNPKAIFNDVIKGVKKCPNNEVYEIAVHPGYPSDTLLNYDKYNTQRLRELEFLKSKDILLDISGIRIANFSEVSELTSQS